MKTGTGYRGVGLCSVLFFELFTIIYFAGLAHARATVDNLAEVEKLFMEKKYERVVTEAGNLIDSGSHGREELNYLKALSLAQLSRHKEARQTFEYMIERYPRGKRAFDGYIGIGDSYFLDNKFNEAIVAYKKASDNFPDHKNSSIVYYKIGNAYQRLGINDKAEDYFAKVRSQSPMSFESRMIGKNPPDTAQINIDQNKEASAYYYIQAGYFKSKSNADKLNAKLRLKGYDSRVETSLKSGVTFYRVRVGEFRSEQEADTAAARLKKDGYATKVCR